MKNKTKRHLHFFVDPKLVEQDRAAFLLQAFLEEKLKYTIDVNDLEKDQSYIVFAHQDNIKYFSKHKNHIVVVDSTEKSDGVSREKINFNSYEEIINFLQRIFIVEKHVFLQSKIKESEEMYDEIRKNNLNISSVDLLSLTEGQSCLIEKLIDLEINLLSEDSIEDWNKHFRSFVKGNTHFHQLSLYSSIQLMKEVGAVEDNTFILHLPFEDLFLFIKLRPNYNIGDSILIESIVTMLMRTIQILDQKLVKSDGEVDFWKKIFSKIPYPMAVISNLGDLLIYNESFAKIGILPKECLRFKDNESFEMFQLYYKVKRIEISMKLMNVSYFVFYTSEGKEVRLPSGKVEIGESRKDSVDELGIISSSIAHELNNPLAGILAALSLLSLEEGWVNENQNDLEDMKNGARRCKELVDIFLGFSKFSPSTGNPFSVKNSLDQAINLLRFRMVESNLRLEIGYNPTLENFTHSVNSSVMSMILYLILSELMTAFAHEKLITQINMSAMEGEVMEFSNQISIKLNYDFEYEDKLAQSKLIQHLLVFEKFEITFLKQEIRLIHRS